MAVTTDFIELDPKPYSTEDLIAAARGRTPIENVTPELAVSLLRRKGGRHVVDDLSALLNDSDLPERVRWTAAVELGRLRSPKAADALRRAQNRGPELVRRGVTQALSQIAVEASPKEPGSQPGLVLPFPEQLLREVTGATSEIRFNHLLSREVQRAAREIARAVGADLDHRRALTIECGQTSLAYLPRKGAGVDPQELLERTTLLGHIAIHWARETDRWERLFDVLTQPGDDRRTAQVLVTSPTGITVYAGVLRASEKGALSFEVDAVKGGGAGPTRVSGSYDGQVSIEEAAASPSPTDLPVVERSVTR